MSQPSTPSCLKKIGLLLLCCSFCHAQTPSAVSTQVSNAASANGATASGFRIYDNQNIPDDIEVIRDIVCGEGGTKILKINIIRQKKQGAEPLPVIVYLPGGGFLRSDKEVATGRLAALAQRGYIGVAAQYRTSLEAPFPAQIEDAKCAIRFLRAKAKDYNIDPDHIGVWGASAGGLLAGLLGTTEGMNRLEGNGGWNGYSSRVQAVSCWYGSFDSRGGSFPPDHPASRFLGGSPDKVPEVAALASPITHISSKTVPVFLVHGDSDRMVPLKYSQTFCQALKRQGIDCELLIVEGADHGFITAVEAEKMLHFFDRHLKRVAK